MPCSRHSSGTGLPASACLRMTMIWLSEERDAFRQNFLDPIKEKILLLTSTDFRGDYRSV